MPPALDPHNFFSLLLSPFALPALFIHLFLVLMSNQGLHPFLSYKGVLRPNNFKNSWLTMKCFLFLESIRNVSKSHEGFVTTVEL
jgi:hypothetical protein